MTWWRYSLFNRRVKFQCRMCRYESPWFDRREVRRAAGSVEVLCEWWEDLHIAGSHMGR